MTNTDRIPHEESSVTCFDSGDHRVLSILFQPFISDRGSTVAARNVIDHLCELDFSVDFCALGPIDPNWETKARCFAMSGTLHDTLSGHIFRSGQREIETIVEDNELLSGVGILYGHHGSFPHSIAMRKMKEKNPDIPFILQLHGTEIQYANNFHDHANELRKTCHAADSIVCPSYYVGNELKKIIGNRESIIKKIRILYLSPHEVFFDGENSISRKSNSVLFIGRLDENKGAHLLLEACNHCSVRPLSVDVIGDGPLSGQLADLSNRHLNDVTVKFHGYGDVGFVKDYLRTASVVVIPTIKVEGFSLVAAEAMATGTPIVSTNVGALPEVLHDAAVFSDPEPCKLGKAIAAVLSNERIQIKLAENGRKRAIRLFNSDVQRGNINAVFSKPF